MSRLNFGPQYFLYLRPVQIIGTEDSIVACDYAYHDSLHLK